MLSRSGKLDRIAEYINFVRSLVPYSLQNGSGCHVFFLNSHHVEWMPLNVRQFQYREVKGGSKKLASYNLKVGRITSTEYQVPSLGGWICNAQKGEKGLDERQT
jgi:hypothetical protein